MLNPTAQELTERYQNDTLAVGNYYFQIANCKPQVGYYHRTPRYLKDALLEKNLTVPQPTIYSEATMYVGVLKTITILAPVPEYQTEEI